MEILKGGKYLTPNGGFCDGDIVIQGTEIVSVGKPFTARDTDTVTDIKGLCVIPGLVDIHTHGAMGIDVSVDSTEKIVELSKFYAKNGVTTFMPTTMTAAQNDIISAAKNIKEASESQNIGASIIGIHAEGPYIDPKRGGCHKRDLIRLPKKEEAAEVKEALGKNLKFRETVAPEMEGAIPFIKYMKDNGGYVSIGHTDADFKTCCEALEAGANSFTHTFNAMSGLHHREPGAVGAAFVSDDAYCELICDGIHVNRAVVNVLKRAKTVEKVILITDSMPVTGLSDQTILFGGIKVIVKDHIARTEDGTLAGSTLLLKNAVKNFAEFADVSFEDAVRCASINPAKAIGADNIIGSIEVGKRADLVILDKDREIVSTYCRGTKID
jgi:N-acetylglucosamine-6-phosphate deacetylase